MRRPTAMLALTGLVLLASCSARESEDETGGTASAIIAGSASDASQDAVALLMVVASNGELLSQCTGTLLAPNLLLTARHCVSAPPTTAFGCDSTGNVLVGEGFGPGTVGADWTPSSLRVFVGAKRPAFGATPAPRSAARGKKILHPDTNLLCSNDIALVVLDSAIKGAKVSPVRLDTKPAAGEKVTTVGWGYTERGDALDRQQRTGVRILRVGPAPSTAVGPAVPPNDFEIAEAICQGDSGGPAFAASGAVVGVVSRGGGGAGGDPEARPPEGCMGLTVRNYYTATSAFRDLIVRAYAEAGATPWTEGNVDPALAKITGEACTKDADCRGGICIENRDGKVCSEACSREGTCPDGLTCTASSDGSKVCVAKLTGRAAPGAAPPSGGCTTAGAPAPAGGFAATLTMLVAMVGVGARRRAAHRSEAGGRGGSRFRRPRRSATPMIP